jgi:hypothetical protein
VLAGNKAVAKIWSSIKAKENEKVKNQMPGMKGPGSLLFTQ